MGQCDTVFKQTYKLLAEQEPIPPAAPPEAAPIPGAAPPADPAAEAPPMDPEQPAPLSPAAEVTLVRLLLKALVINLEDDDLDTMQTIDGPEITQENAEEVKENLIRVIHKHETRGDNEDRRDVLHNLSVNEKNVKGVLNKTVNVMKKYSNIDLST
jgi:predicted lipid-binding transport protein (Tim44 family)